MKQWMSKEEIKLIKDLKNFTKKVKREKRN